MKEQLILGRSMPILTMKICRRTPTMNMSETKRVLPGLIVIFFLFTQTAYGYIDPGSGSYFLQLLLAGLFAALYLLKQYWLKVKSFVVSLLKKRAGNESA